MDIFTEAYITCALWAEMDNADEQGGEPLDVNYGVGDLAPETRAAMIEDCAAFQKLNSDDINDDLQAGHDLPQPLQGQPLDRDGYQMADETRHLVDSISQGQDVANGLDGSRMIAGTIVMPDRPAKHAR